MTNTSEPLPPEARKVIRLAIATHLLQPNGLTLVRPEMEVAVDHAFFMADLLILKSGL
jgi:hypothetical protein